MPDWNLPEYQDLKIAIENYINGLNQRDYKLLANTLSNDCKMAKNVTYLGKENIINWFKKIFNSSEYSLAKFELLDASASFFDNTEAQALLYMEFRKDDSTKQIHIESLFFNKIQNKWLISRIFGLAYSPYEHINYFNPFLT